MVVLYKVACECLKPFINRLLGLPLWLIRVVMAWTRCLFFLLYMPVLEKPLYHITLLAFFGRLHKVCCVSFMFESFFLDEGSWDPIPVWWWILTYPSEISNGSGLKPTLYFLLAPLYKRIIVSRAWYSLPKFLDSWLFWFLSDFFFRA